MLLLILLRLYLMLHEIGLHLYLRAHVLRVQPVYLAHREGRRCGEDRQQSEIPLKVRYAGLGLVEPRPDEADRCGEPCVDDGKEDRAEVPLDLVPLGLHAPPFLAD